MSARPPLALIAVGADADRLRQALMLGRAEIALGGTARLFAQGGSVMLFRSAAHHAEDARWQAVGEPTLARLIDEALQDGLAIGLCQTSVAMMALATDDFPAGIAFTGPIAFLADLATRDRLLTI